MTSLSLKKWALELVKPRKRTARYVGKGGSGFSLRPCLVSMWNFWGVSMGLKMARYHTHKNYSMNHFLKLVFGSKDPKFPRSKISKKIMVLPWHTLEMPWTSRKKNPWPDLAIGVATRATTIQVVTIETSKSEMGNANKPAGMILFEWKVRTHI